ncbi:HAUS augmin-like complex subunit 1 [Actinia tenebrosa]|uniref:HAUS augmin-like complex subunit 1 n=1 Tax=Actinia tenebrosa TaxID=6105 RepID=A0A6P8IJ11_ACTTE|nr:HAUS augmin-like complex subunit 1 [Actinia tenebrosa]
MELNEQKHFKVKLWLEGLFGDEPIPQYEINNKTIEILEQMADRNMRCDRDAEIVIEDMVQKTAEYDFEAQRISRILNDVGITLTSLSQSGSHSIKTLSEVSLLLGLKDCSSSSLMLGIANQSCALDAILDERAEEKRVYSRLLAKTKSSLVKANTLQRALETLEEQHTLQKPILDKRSQETGFLQSKAKEYQRIVKELEEYQKSLGLESSIFHENLVKKAEDINLLKEKSKPLKNKLESYQNLPPDLSLAKVKVEEAKRELARLEQQLSSNIDMLHI